MNATRLLFWISRQHFLVVVFFAPAAAEYRWGLRDSPTKRRARLKAYFLEALTHASGTAFISRRSRKVSESPTEGATRSSPRTLDPGLFCSHARYKERAGLGRSQVAYVSSALRPANRGACTDRRVGELISGDRLRGPRTVDLGLFCRRALRADRNTGLGRSLVPFILPSQPSTLVALGR